MNTIETTPQPAVQPIQRPRQKYLSTEQALQYIKDVYGVQIARSTLYKKRSLEKEGFIGKRSPFGKLVFDPEQIDRYMQTGNARATVQHEEA
ncbi:MAG: hypothetical protein WCK32_08260 [Chlorobiaceae bacterium]